MIERIYPIYIVQDAQKGRSARPERAKQTEVEIEVEQKIRLSSLNLSLSRNLPVSWQTFSASY